MTLGFIARWRKIHGKCPNCESKHTTAGEPKPEIPINPCGIGAVVITATMKVVDHASYLDNRRIETCLNCGTVFTKDV